MTKPLLLIDVDGPLNPWRANKNRRPRGYETHRLNPLTSDGRRWVTVNRRLLRVWLNPAHGPALMDLPFELVWCTTWVHEANEMIGPAIGLPELPVVEFDKQWTLPTRGDGTYFKTHDVVAYAAGRPFAWIDDEVSDFDREYVTTHHRAPSPIHPHSIPAPALLHHVDPRLGLLDSDFEALAAWAASL